MAVADWLAKDGRDDASFVFSRHVEHILSSTQQKNGAAALRPQLKASALAE
jgi:hypothetical protein